MAAVGRINDQTLIAEMAKTDPDSYVRLKAVSRLQNQKILAEIAKNETDELVRLSAVDRLQDKDLLADIAENGKTDSMRQTAKQRLDRLNKNKPVIPARIINTNDTNKTVFETTTNSQNVLIASFENITETNAVKIENADDKFSHLIAESKASATEKTSEGVNNVNGEWVRVKFTYIEYKKIPVSLETEGVAEYVQIAKTAVKRSPQITEDHVPIVEIQGEVMLISFPFIYEKPCPEPGFISQVRIDIKTKKVLGILGV